MAKICCPFNILDLKTHKIFWKNPKNLRAKSAKPATHEIHKPPQLVPRPSHSVLNLCTQKSELTDLNNVGSKYFYLVIASITLWWTCSLCSKMGILERIPWVLISGGWATELTLGLWKWF